MGHVQRSRDVADRRRVRLTVTDRAQQLGQDFFGPLIRRIMDIAAALDAHEVDTIMRFLAAVASQTRPNG